MRLLRRLLEESGVACEVRLPSGEEIRCGSGPAAFRVVLHSDRALRRGLDEMSLGQAYVEGEMDIEGDLWSVLELRDRLQDRLRAGPLLRFLAQLFLLAPTRVNKKSIADHYSFGDDFYHSFIDTRYHFYSHCLFHSGDETLEEAAEHKLETMFRALELKPGMRLLDIGGGWGGVIRYCGPRGVHVTSLTLAEDSHRYISDVLAATGLPGEVRFQDFLEHRPERPYDAVVIYGVIEHIPNYRHFCARAWDCLAPGGRLYMDASASKEKYSMSAFTRRYIWHGTHTFLSLQDMAQELLWHGFEIEEVKRETRDYELTIRHWAERLDAARDFVVGRWGEQVYRAFRVYLWGGCHAFHTDRLQAYHLVARRRPEPGPRPGLARRVRSFVRGLA
ncbi:MAG TPA: class I SAM-dependent methyltransferase [Thermoanaerobaculia bacterium]